ncbi:MAG TPA: DegV family protein [Candidatus Limnocylindrales bacterium]
MSRVAIVTDSASDLPPADAAAAGIGIVPLAVNFGSETFRAGVDLSTEDFWKRMTAPDAPFPTTAASAPGEFKAVYEKALAGADAVVAVHVAATLSGTMKSAEIAKGMLPDRQVHLVDSGSASMGEGLLALLGAEMAAAGASAEAIVGVLEDRKKDLDLFVALDTLEYLKRGGRISGARAAIGTILSVKPIITIRDGVVETADRPRTRGKARERTIELLVQRPIERLAVLYTPPADPEAFRDEVLARAGRRIDPKHVSIQAVGASVGPHLGPGCLGAVVLYAR